MEDLPVPLSRVELYLAKACGMDVTVPEAPESRLEQYLAILAGDTSVEMPAPMSLTEQWLAYVLGVTPDPLLAVEGACYIDNQKVDVRYFAVAAGMPGAVLPPAPQNRKEQYWANIQGGGGGVLKYVTGTIIALTDVVRGITSLENVYGNTTQDGTPTPDAPVAVNVVTGEQSVWVHGKNLFNISKVLTNSTRLINNGDGTITVNIPSNDLTVRGASPNKLSDYCQTLKVGDTVILSFVTTGTTKRIYLVGTGANLAWDSGTSKTITQAMLDAQVAWYGSGINTTATISNIQVELGSTSTAYEPYQSATYTVNLGSIELCKVGNYQDYIYKSGSDWYVHKEFGKIVLDGSEDWGSNSTRYFYTVVDDALIFRDTGINSPIISNYYPVAPSIVIYNRGVSYGIALDQGSSRFRLRNSDFGSDATLLQSWLSTHNTTVYYALATATDTKITDATLISQLNAVGSAVLPKPNAYIEVSADSTNLPGSLKISYYGEEE